MFSVVVAFAALLVSLSDGAAAVPLQIDVLYASRGATIFEASADLSVPEGGTVTLSNTFSLSDPEKKGLEGDYPAATTVATFEK
jgi:hypothetical protein